MRDDQVRRYARHILVPDIGGLGQTALLVATARMALREREADAEMIAAQFLVAGGVGTLVIRGATEAQRARLAAHGPDTTLVTEPATPGQERLPGGGPNDAAGPHGAAGAHGAASPNGAAGTSVVLQPKPPWWPTTDDDGLALAYWRGAIAATRWMAAIANA